MAGPFVLRRKRRVFNSSVERDVASELRSDQHAEDEPSFTGTPPTQYADENPLCSAIAALLTLVFVPNARTASLPTQPPGSARSLAFARYLASLENGNPLDHSGPVAMSIEASLPGLYKEASFLAVRDQEDGLTKYHLLALAGDGTVLAEVIGRYFAVAQEMDDSPASSAGITPANYKFRFAGEVSTGGTPAHSRAMLRARNERPLGKLVFQVAAQCPLATPEAGVKVLDTLLTRIGARHSRGPFR